MYGRKIGSMQLVKGYSLLKRPANSHAPSPDHAPFGQYGIVMLISDQCLCCIHGQLAGFQQAVQ